MSFSATGIPNGMSLHAGDVCEGRAGLGASGIGAGAMLHPHSPFVQQPCSQRAVLSSPTQLSAATTALALAITAIQRKEVMKVLIQE